MDFWLALWAWLLTTLITIGVSLLTTAQPMHQLAGIVYRRAQDINRSYGSGVRNYQRVGFWATVSCIVFLAINIYFW